ncbi:diaminopimelate decarboxylase [Mycobacterium sp. 1165196.3]|nr:diaminopimelate decarboxylase [Mycobacterium sp. 1165196.3]
MTWTVDVDLITDWLSQLDDDSYDLAIAAMEILENVGPALREPLVKKITSSRHNNMKELRPGSTGAQKIRVLFAFDTQRVAVMLVGGDKAGDWSRWYDENIAIADDLFDQHLEALEEEQKKQGKQRKRGTKR